MARLQPRQAPAAQCALERLRPSSSRFQPGFEVVSTTVAVENDDGRWVGTSTGMEGVGFFTDTAVLHGEGAYEGLTAYLIVEWAPPSATFVGAIFPGEMPPFPEPPAE